MKRYLVGGAVRDALLGLPVKDRDWVVVGATPEAMLAAGYRQVGRDFPVFLHPETAEEHALARTERKTGPGYHGFKFDTSPDITLEQDLQRRDLTINAMARDERGELIDPFGGAADLENRVLRHVSEAFREDPVRVLRVARFAARFAGLGFAVAAETRALMRDMVAAQEVDALVAERVWLDTEKALAAERPSAFLFELRSCGALAKLFPEVDRLYGVPQTARHHPEIDTGIHTELVLDMAAKLAPGDSMVGFAALTHDLGKGLTPKEAWPSHLRHESAGVDPLRALCRRLKVPKAHQQLAERVCRQHLNCHRAAEMRPAKVLKLIVAVDGLRQPERFEQFLLACEADARGRLGMEGEAYPPRELLRVCREAAAAVSTDPLREQGLAGAELGAALEQARIRAVSQAAERFVSPAS